MGSVVQSPAHSHEAEPPRRLALSLAEGGDPCSRILSGQQDAAIQHPQSGVGAQSGEPDCGVGGEWPLGDLEMPQSRESSVEATGPRGADEYLRQGERIYDEVVVDLAGEAGTPPCRAGRPPRRGRR